MCSLSWWVSSLSWLRRTQFARTCRCTSVSCGTRTTLAHSGWSTTRSLWKDVTCRVDDLGNTIRTLHPLHPTCPPQARHSKHTHPSIVMSLYIFLRCLALPSIQLHTFTSHRERKMFYTFKHNSLLSYCWPPCPALPRQWVTENAVHRHRTYFPPKQSFFHPFCSFRSLIYHNFYIFIRNLNIT